MKNLIQKTMITIITAIAICMIVSIIMTIFAPTLENDIAMGQMSNDNAGFMAMEGWNRISMFAEGIQGITIIAAIALIANNFIKYFKNRKDK